MRGIVISGFIALVGAMTSTSFAPGIPVEPSEATDVNASEPEPSSEPGQARIPFDPPLRRPLFYRLVLSDPDGRTTRIGMFVTFSRPDPVGYHRIAVRYEPEGPLSRSDPLLPVLLRPIELAMDSVTPPMFEQPQEEEAYWAANEAAVETMVRQIGGGPADVPAVRAAVRRVRTLGHPDQILALTRYIYPLVRFFGDELTVGDAEGGYGTVETAVGPVSYTNEWTLERVEGGIAHIRYRRVVEPEEQARVREAYRTAQGRVPTDDDMRLILPPERRGTYRLSMRTGLPVYFDETEVAWERASGAVRQRVATHRLELESGSR